MEYGSPFVVSNNRKMTSSAFSEERYARTGVLWDAIGVDIWVLNLKNGAMQKHSHRATATIGSRLGRLMGGILAFAFPIEGEVPPRPSLDVGTGFQRNKASVSHRYQDGTGDAVASRTARGLLVSILPENAARNDDAKLPVDLADREKEPGPAVPTVTVYRSGVSSADGMGATPSDPWRLGGHPFGSSCPGFIDR